MVKGFRRVDNSLGGFFSLLHPWRSQRHSVALLMLLIVAGLSRHSMGASMAYNGPFVGNTVTYGNVIESSLTDPVPMYNAPNLTGDSLDFTPTNLASSSTGVSSDITDAQLTFPIDAQAGEAIHNLQISESGSVTLSGTGTAATKASAAFGFAVNILQVDGVGINAITLGPDDFPPAVFSPSNGDFNLAADGVLNAQPWSGLLFLDFDQVLVDRGISFTRGVTRISFNLNDRLNAVSELNSSAMIVKDSFTVTTNVPEPTTCGLALLGAIACMVAVRRSR